MSTQSSQPRPLRVGHKGADHIAPGNTIASFDAALAHGVDMIEFDVLSENPDGTGTLRLAHDYSKLKPGGDAPTLNEGLAHLAGGPFNDIALDVDLKLPGYEIEVLEALREHGLVARSLVSSQYAHSLAILRAAEPALQLGWSVPKLRRDPTAHPFLRVPATGVLLAYRRALPRRAAAAIGAGRCDALMSQYRLITPRLVSAVHEAGGRIFAWTVDDAANIKRLEAMGVDGVITNDPRLFDRT